MEERKQKMAELLSLKVYLLTLTPGQGHFHIRVGSMKVLANSKQYEQYSVCHILDTYDIIFKLHLLCHDFYVGLQHIRVQPGRIGRRG